MNPIIECVPNFSEGRRPEVIEAIAAAIAGEGVRILHIDRGEAANRTVITFAGAPEAVCEAAFRGVQEAARLIDMRTHHGTHPRLGATDVLPLVPVQGISLEECAKLARQLAQRIWIELGIPCYCYGAAAASPDRSELSWCRKGEYEALAAKLADPVLRPDFGPGTVSAHIARTGATTVDRRHQRRRPALPHRRQLQPPARRTSRAGRREGHRQADAGAGMQGHRLVHRRIRMRPGIHESHRHLARAPARSL